jgi:hypothetical protein
LRFLRPCRKRRPKDSNPKAASGSADANESENLKYHRLTYHRMFSSQRVNKPVPIIDAATAPMNKKM